MSKEVDSRMDRGETMPHGNDGGTADTATLPDAPSEQVEIDPLTFSVIINRFQSITREMTLALERSAHTSILALAKDFSCGLYDADFRQVDVHEGLPIHTSSMDLVLREIAAAFPANIQDGDVFMCNDPSRGNTHIGDLVIARPVFVDGQHTFWTVARGHQMDTGAFIPSSISAAPRDVWQEGLTIPPVRLFEGGALREDLLELYLSNVRYRAGLRGDLFAQIGSTSTGARRVLELCDEFGRDGVLRYLEAVIEYADRRTAEAIREIPDGSYTAQGWIDSDGVDREDILIQVRVDVEGDQVRVDYTGSAEQGGGGINGSRATSRATGVVPFLYYLDSDIPHNDGCLTHITVEAPEGTICRARYPASTSCATVCPSDMMHDVINRAMARAIPDRVRAGSARCANIPQLAGADPDTGEPWAVMMFTGGGHGAAKGADGWPLIQTLAAMGVERALPVEHTELLYPLIVETMEIEPDSMGAGEWIGGPGLRVSLICTAGAMDCVTFGDGFRNPPHGVMGGQPGIGGGQYAEDLSSHERTFVSACGGVVVPEGARWVSVSTGGGGYGRPVDRPAELVRRDLRDGWISVETAEHVFGVVTTGGDDPAVDEDATRRCRERLAAQPAALVTPVEAGAGTWLDANMTDRDRYVVNSVVTSSGATQ